MADINRNQIILMYSDENTLEPETPLGLLVSLRHKSSRYNHLLFWKTVVNRTVIKVMLTQHKALCARENPVNIYQNPVLSLDNNCY